MGLWAVCFCWFSLSVVAITSSERNSSRTVVVNASAHAVRAAVKH